MLHSSKFKLTTLNYQESWLHRMENNQLKITNETIKTIVSQMADKVAAEKDYLTKLDSDIGDADHGVNLNIGFQSVMEQLPNLDVPNLSIKAFTKKIGFTLLDKIGGASGPLYGSFFMKLGNDLNDEQEVSEKVFFNMLNNGVLAIQKRGKVSLGEKTMYDVIKPTVDFLLENESLNTDDLFSETKILAQKNFDEVTEMFPKKGRAARLGENAIGHPDPGSASIQFLINIICDTLSNHD